VVIGTEKVGVMELHYDSIVLIGAKPRSLLVMEDATSGWADLGHPERVISTLDRHQIEPQWLTELRTAESNLNQRVALKHQTISAFSELVTA
jgi:hypothetical protein